MKILLIGSDKVWAIENFYYTYLNELGAKTEFFLAQSLFYDYYNQSVAHKILFKLGLSSIYKKINQEFKNAVESTMPDIIFIFKGMEIAPSSLKWARDKGVKLVGYNPDNPFLFSSKGSGNKYVTESIGLYDLHLTYNGSVLQELKDQYHIPVSFLPFGFNLPDDLYTECLQQDEILKACFLGNPDKERAEFITGIAEANIQVDVFGNDWQKFVKHPNITLHEAVYGSAFWKIIRRYRVQLNLMRPHNPDSHNMRTFEVPGAGGILLAPDTLEHRSFFVPGKEVFLFKGLDDCIKQLRNVLALTKEEADVVRRQARERSLKSGYTYKHRAGEALEAMKKLVA